MPKTLVAYFSCSGVTAAAAKKLAAAADADLFEIRPSQAYTEADVNWRNPLSRCNREKLKGTKPALAEPVPDLTGYDAVYVCYPVWYYTVPLIIHSFLSGGDFTGKRVVLFLTSGGSSFGKAVGHVQKTVPGAVVEEGCSLNGDADAAIRAYLGK